MASPINKSSHHGLQPSQAIGPSATHGGVGRGGGGGGSVGDGGAAHCAGAAALAAVRETVESLSTRVPGIGSMPDGLGYCH